MYEQIPHCWWQYVVVFMNIGTCTRLLGYEFYLHIDMHLLCVHFLLSIIGHL